MKRHPLPGPGTRPLIGHAPESLADPLGSLDRWVERYGPLVGVRILGQPTIIAAAPAMVEHVLLDAASRYTKGFQTQRLASPFGQGLLVSDGDLWLRQRRQMQPAFAREHTATYVARIPRVAASEIANWSSRGDEIELTEAMMDLSRKLFVKLLVGNDVAGANLHADLAEIQYHFAHLLNWPSWVPTPRNLRFKRALDNLKAFIATTLTRRLTEDTPRDDMLGILMSPRNGTTAMPLDRLQDEVLSLFLAGHETTALTLTYAVDALGRHPDAAARLQAEIDSVIGDRLPIPEDLPNLQVTRWTIQETLRLFPPVWAMFRDALEDDSIEGHRIPRGSLVVLPQWTIQRDPGLFERPLSFEPERWQDGLERRLPRFAYFPFGGGSRLCIGNHLSMMEATLLLALLVQMYRFQPLSPAPRLRAAVTLVPASKLRVRLERRGSFLATSSSAR
ncbi:MAG: cytochrome P450 [bacterium]|nr:cytochrome P450 [bacterium]